MLDMGEYGWPKADFGPAKAVGRSQTRPVEVLGLPSVHSHKVFKMLCIYFMITAFNTKNQFYYCWVQGKRTPFGVLWV